MKIIAVIPARYNSSRFPGKPLADLCGYPMIWWVYHSVKKSSVINDVYVATDDERIASVCQSYNINYIMTSENHQTSTERLHEVSTKIDADLYICVNGDEPLIKHEYIEQIIPVEYKDNSNIYVANLTCKISKPSEVIDFTNIKVVIGNADQALFMSRNPIPYPKNSLDFNYFKHIGVLIYNKKALQFFVDTPKGYNEKIEDINELRFIENGVHLHMIKVLESGSISVDTPKDLEQVKDIISKTMDNK